jgi:hypothetical protein
VFDVQVRPSKAYYKDDPFGLWGEKPFKHWCKKMFEYLEETLGHCGQTWTSRKCKATNTLHIKFREMDHAAMFLLAHK